MPRAQRRDERSDYVRTKKNYKRVHHRRDATNWFFKYPEKDFAEPCFSEDDPQLETATGSLWRWLLGERAPELRCLYRQDHSVSGIASHAIDDFVSAMDICREQPDFFSVSNLIKYDIASLLTAAYLLEENDLHRTNWGYSEKLGKFVKIDHGRSLWSIRRPFIHNFEAYDENKFIIHPEDILRFPNLLYTLFYYWPATTGYSNSDFERGASSNFLFKNVSRLTYSPEFIERKYYIMLKFIMMPEIVIKQIANLHLDSIVTRNLFVRTVLEKQATLIDALMQTPHLLSDTAHDDSPIDFQYYLTHQKDDLIKSLHADYQQFLFENPDFASLNVNYCPETVIDKLETMFKAPSHHHPLG